MNTKHQLLSLIAAIGISTTLTASADSNGVYLLGSIGRSDIGASRSDVDTLNVNDGFQLSSTAVHSDSLAYKAQIGYQFDPNWAIEGGYMDLGKSTFISTTALGVYDGDVTARLENLDFVGMIPAGRHFVFLAKVGGYYWRTNANLPAVVGGTTGITDNGWNVTFGAGLQYNFTDYFGLRAEFERFNGIGNNNATGDSKVDLMSAGAVLKF